MRNLRVARRLAGVAAASLALAGCGSGGSPPATGGETGSTTAESSGVASTENTEQRSPEAGNASEIGTLEPGKLQVGLTLAYAPYSYIDDGEPAGFDVEALQMVADELGVELELNDIKFAQAILDVKSGKFDLTPGLYMTPERAESVDFVPYFSAGTAIVAPAEGESPSAPEDLCGKEVSSIKGGAVVAKVREETSPACVAGGKDAVVVREYPSDPEATQALITGAVDYQLTETIIAQEVIDRTDAGLRITNDEPIFPVQVGWGIAKGNDDLHQALTSALERVTESDAYVDLLDEYGLSPHDPEMAAESIRSK